MLEGPVKYGKMSGSPGGAQTGAEDRPSLRFRICKLTCPLAQPSLSNFPPEKIRNLVNIAHIDHGKSCAAGWA
jgi:hypothetical protein